METTGTETFGSVTQDQPSTTTEIWVEYAGELRYFTHNKYVDYFTYYQHDKKTSNVILYNQIKTSRST